MKVKIATQCISEIYVTNTKNNRVYHLTDKLWCKGQNLKERRRYQKKYRKGYSQQPMHLGSLIYPRSTGNESRPGLRSGKEDKYTHCSSVNQDE